MPSHISKTAPLANLGDLWKVDSTPWPILCPVSSSGTPTLAVGHPWRENICRHSEGQGSAQEAQQAARAHLQRPPSTSPQRLQADGAELWHRRSSAGGCAGGGSGGDSCKGPTVSSLSLRHACVMSHRHDWAFESSSRMMHHQLMPRHG